MENHPAQLAPAQLSASRAAWQWSARVPGTMRAQHVRLACLDYLHRHAASGSDIAGAELIVGELVANVVRHAQGSASFHIDWRGRHPWLLVLDEGPGFQTLPTTSLADPSAECGRGLALIQTLALELELGNRPEGGGYVRVTLPVERRLRTTAW